MRSKVESLCSMKGTDIYGLSVQMGMSYPELCISLSGTPSRELLQRICDILGADISELLPDEPGRNTARKKKPTISSDYDTIGDAVMRNLREHGWSVRELARKTGNNPSTMSRFIRHSVPRIFELADIVGLDVSELAGQAQ